MEEPARIHSLLDECVTDGTPILVMAIDRPGVWYARLLAISTGKELDLELSAGQANHPRGGERCCFSFVRRGESGAFFGTILRVEDGRRVGASYPERILGREARRAYRVPVVPNGLFVQAKTHDGQTWAPVPIDISLLGILVEFPHDPGLAIGSEIQLRLRRADEVLDLKGEVRRSDGRRYGIFFGALATADHVATAVLRRILSSLELIWLRSRIRA